MEMYIDCIACTMRQAIEAIKLSTNDDTVKEHAVGAVLAHLASTNLKRSPMEISLELSQVIKDITKTHDPYSQLKENDNKSAFTIVKSLELLAKSSNDIIGTCAKLAIAGNVIDYGPGHIIDAEKEVRSILSGNLAIDDTKKLKHTLENSRNIAYLADNAGEIMFDKLFIEQMIGKNITLYVRKHAILNDVTLKDAIGLNLESLATLKEMDIDRINSGQFMNELKSYDMIISKGQGNYELFSSFKLPIFFLLKAKCSMIAEHIGVNLGECILLHSC